MIKLSSDKVTYPGVKQVYRLIDAKGIYREDLLVLEGEHVQEYLEDGLYNDLSAVPLLRQAITQGRRILPRESIHRIRDYVSECVSKMPQSALKIIEPTPYVSMPSRGLIGADKEPQMRV